MPAKSWHVKYTGVSKEITQWQLAVGTDAVRQSGMWVVFGHVGCDRTHTEAQKRVREPRGAVGCGARAMQAWRLSISILGSQWDCWDVACDQDRIWLEQEAMAGLTCVSKGEQKMTQENRADN